MARLASDLNSDSPEKLPVRILPRTALAPVVPNRATPTPSPSKRTASAASADILEAITATSPSSSEEFPDKTHLPRPNTPPATGQKSRLASPKKRAAVPPTPQRQSTDALFWASDYVNDWNDQHSPRKTLQSPSKSATSTRKLIALFSNASDCDTDSEPDWTKHASPGPVLSPSKRMLQIEQQKRRKLKQINLQARATFEARKSKVASDFLAQLDECITNNGLSQLSESTGGIRLIWSNKLNSTAGRAHWKREGIRSISLQGEATVTTYRHFASIELAEKVVQDEARLLNVLAHEFCHLANFMISNVRNCPHGASFREWAGKVTDKFGHSHGIEVTTKHDYDISYKYLWVCADDDGCATEYARHSRSIDPSKHKCGRCNGRLAQVRPKPRGGNLADGVVQERVPTAYQTFVKQNFNVVRGELPPGSPMKDVMKEVGVRYREVKDKAIPAIDRPASPLVHRATGFDETRQYESRRPNTNNGLLKSSEAEVIEILDDTTDEEAASGTAKPEANRHAPSKDIDGVARMLDFLSVKER